MEYCRACGRRVSLKRGDGGLRRRGVDTKIKGHGIDCTVLEGLKSSLGVEVTPSESVCEACYKHISRVTVLSEKVSTGMQELSAEKKKLEGLVREKPTFAPSPKAKKMCLPKQTSPVPPRRVKATFLGSVTNHIKHYNYDTAFRAMYFGSKSAKKDFHKVIESIIREEVRTFSNRLPVPTFRQDLTLETIEKYSWHNLLEEVDSGLPLLSTVIKASLTSSKLKDMLSCNDKKIGPAVPALGLIMGLILHQRFPTRFKFLQQVISIQMLRSGCNKQVFRWFNKFGLCMNITTTRQLVDTLGKHYDRKVKQWKRDIEKEVLGVQPQPVTDHAAAAGDDGDWLSDDEEVEEVDAPVEDGSDNEDLHMTVEEVDDNIDDSDSEDGVQPHQDVPLPETQDVSSPESQDDSLSEAEESNDVGGFSVCWDKVMKLHIVQYPSKKQGSKLMLWANCFATKDRIAFHHLPENWENTKPASKIDIDSILPGDNEWLELQCRMVKMVERILVKVLELDIEAEEHIQHEYTDESSEKSEVVNLGVLKENPTTCQGVIQIMKYLERYVPSDGSGNVWPIICHGDQLSVEKMIEGKVAMSSCSEPAARLEGLIPRPQNFHKRVVLLQGTLDMLYGKGAGDKGTFTQIKNYFGYRGVTKRAKDCMNHLVDFMDFITEGHVILLASHLKDTDKLEDCLSNKEDVTALSKEIVRFVWPTMENYMSAVEDERQYSCICNDEDGGVDWVECSSGNRCKTRWFHQQCVAVGSEVEDEDWWCSDECKEKGLRLFCCGKQKEDSWTECQSGTKCLRNQWFHSSCVASTTNAWYCSEVCRTSQNTDHKQAYAMSTLWRGLLHYVERDAEMENDGLAMINLWRLNMLEFWEYGHFKYLMLAYRLLASVNGWMPERIQQNLIWNSTANLQGEAGANIPLDLVNDFLNNEFRTNLRRMRGQYTDSAVHRCSLIAGTVGQGLEDKFMTEIIDKYVANKHSSKPSHKKDLNKFVKMYQGEKLFDCLPGREHSGYPGFVHCLPVKQPEKLRDRLVEYGVKLDTERLLTK